MLRGRGRSLWAAGWKEWHDTESKAGMFHLENGMGKDEGEPALHCLIPSSFPSLRATWIHSPSCCSSQLSCHWLVLQVSVSDCLPPFHLDLCQLILHSFHSTNYLLLPEWNPSFSFFLGLKMSPPPKRIRTSVWLSLVRRLWLTWPWKAVSTVTRCCCCCVRPWNTWDAICTIWGESHAIAVLSIESMLWALLCCWVS